MRIHPIADIRLPPDAATDDSVLVIDDCAAGDDAASTALRGRVLLLANHAHGAWLEGLDLRGCRFSRAARGGQEMNRNLGICHSWHVNGADLRGADLRGILPGQLEELQASGAQLEGALTGVSELVCGRPKDQNAPPVLITYQGDSNGGVISWDPAAPAAQGVKWSAVGGHPIAGGCCWGAALAEGAGILWRKKEVRHYRADEAPGYSFVSAHYEGWAAPAQLAAMVEGDELARRLHKYAQVDWETVLRPRIVAEVRDVLRLLGVTFA